MLKRKRLAAFLLAASLLCSVIPSGCTDSGGGTPSQQSSSSAENPAGESSQESTEESQTPEMSGELKLLGPGKFTEVGPDGATDPVTGLFRPGYNEVVELFQEKYPKVTLKIEAIPWDSYQAKIQT